MLSAMDSKIKQRVSIKFCMKLRSATETLEMLREAFGEHSLSQTAVFEWHSRFKVGRVSAEDDRHSGQPSTSKMTENVEKIQELNNKGHRQTIHELADTTGISYGVCSEILTENLSMNHTALSSGQRTCPHNPENHRVCD
jgi:hypothetical protein